MTQRELAKAASLSPSYISDILSGRKELTARSAHAIAPALRVPFPWLFMGMGEPPNFAASEPQQTAETAVCPPSIAEPGGKYLTRQRGIYGAPPPVVRRSRRP